MARILNVLEQKRDVQDILVDAGDLFQGSYIANTSNGSIIVSAFNLMKYDFYIPGNHEFEFGSCALRENLENMKSDILCANWRFNRKFDKIRSYAVLKRNGMNIAVIGVGERESRTRILPDKALSFSSEEKAIALCLKELRHMDIDLIVLVRHGGIYFKGGSLYSLLKKFPEIDLVIGGHSHQLERGRKIAGAYYVQPGCMAQGISEIRIKFNDKSRKIERIASFFHDAAEFEPSQNMSELLQLENKYLKDAYCEIVTDISEKRSQISDIRKYVISSALDENVKADADMFLAADSDYVWNGILNKFFVYRLFPHEDRVVTVPVDRKEYKTILEECRKYADKYSVQLFHRMPKKDFFLLRTSEFILSGGGRNFPAARRIAEKKINDIKKYQSLRHIVTEHLLKNSKL